MQEGVSDLISFLDNPEAVKNYWEWVQNNPMTVRVRKIAEAWTDPSSLGSSPTGEKALYEYGKVEGYKLLLKFLFNLPVAVNNAREIAKAESLPADYGALTALEKEGIKKKGDVDE